MTEDILDSMVDPAIVQDGEQEDQIL